MPESEIPVSQKGPETLTHMICTALRFLVLAVGVTLNGLFCWMIYDLSQGSIIIWPWVAGGFAMYAAVLMSPFGDNCLDLLMNCRKPTSDEAEKLEKAETELRNRAERFLETFPPQLRLRVIDDPFPNAVAFGHRTIAMTTETLMYASEAELRGLVAHEAGHILRRDTRFRLFINAMYGPALLIGQGSLALARAVMNKAKISFFDPFFGLVHVFVAGFVIMLFIFPILSLVLHRIFQFLLSFTSRACEFAADATAVRLTRDDGLISALSAIEQLEQRPSGAFLAAYRASHPPTTLRVERARKLLEELVGSSAVSRNTTRPSDSTETSLADRIILVKL